jgi:hypothetical protein
MGPTRQWESPGRLTPQWQGAQGRGARSRSRGVVVEQQGGGSEVLVLNHRQRDVSVLKHGVLMCGPLRFSSVRLRDQAKLN